MADFFASLHPEMAKPKPQPNRRWLWISLGVLAVLIAAGLIFWWMRSRSAAIQAGFPAELIAEPGAYSTESYHIDPSGVGQANLNYISNKTLIGNIAAFHALLQQNGWQIMRDANPQLTTSFIYAVKGSSVLNVTFDATNPKAVKVSETYVANLPGQ